VETTMTKWIIPRIKGYFAAVVLGRVKILQAFLSSEVAECVEWRSGYLEASFKPTKTKTNKAV
jgi:hypothetical protein